MCLKTTVTILPLRIGTYVLVRNVLEVTLMTWNGMVGDDVYRTGGGFVSCSVDDSKTRHHNEISKWHPVYPLETSSTI